MRHLFGLLCLLLLCGCGSITEENTGKRYPDVTVSRLIRVYDGDTFICDIDELSPLIGKNIRVRLKNINTPEIRDKDESLRAAALAEKERLERLLNGAKVIELRNIERCKYFRIQADVFVDGENILAKLNRKYVMTPLREPKGSD